MCRAFMLGSSSRTGCPMWFCGKSMHLCAQQLTKTFCAVPRTPALRARSLATKPAAGTKERLWGLLLAAFAATALAFAFADSKSGALAVASAINLRYASGSVSAKSSSIRHIPSAFAAISGGISNP